MDGSMNLHVDAIDWAHWQPTEEANLCFVIRDGQVLLIHKKRGLGAGKINGPGGRLEPGETALQAAVREMQEELGVTPTGLEQVGELHFQFLDGYKLHVAVFVASGCHGKLVETDEASGRIWTRFPITTCGRTIPTGFRCCWSANCFADISCSMGTSY